MASTKTTSVEALTEALQRLDERLKAHTNPSSVDAQALHDEAVSACAVLKTLAHENVTLAAELRGTQRGLDPKRKGNPTERRHDALRLAWVLAPALLAYNFPAGWSGTLSVAAAMLYIVALIVAVSVRSDVTYAHKGGPIRDSDLGTWAYALLPSRLLAVFVVAGIFCGVWFGFAALFQSCELTNGGTCAPPHPFELSFLTLGTFDGPASGLANELRLLVLVELGCAIFLTLGIFGLLINRLSEFD